MVIVEFLKLFYSQKPMTKSDQTYRNDLFGVFDSSTDFLSLILCKHFWMNSDFQQKKDILGCPLCFFKIVLFRAYLIYFKLETVQCHPSEVLWQSSIFKA